MPREERCDPYVKEEVQPSRLFGEGVERIVEAFVIVLLILILLAVTGHLRL